MDWHTRVVSISSANPEQLEEHFLCEVNRDGQVPVLTNKNLLAQPMPESVEISLYISEWYPSLLPPSHKKDIRQLIEELHDINYGVLTFGTGSRHPTILLQRVEDLMKAPDTSARYRKALQYKFDV